MKNIPLLLSTVTIINFIHNTGIYCHGFGTVNVSYSFSSRHRHRHNVIINHREQHSMKWVLQSTLTPTSSSSSSNITPTIHQISNGNNPLQLIPKAINPIMFTSSVPLLTKVQCEKLATWCQTVIAKYGTLTNDALIKDLDDDKEGAQIMVQLQKIIHENIMGLKGSDDYDDYVMPRYISYIEPEKQTILDNMDAVSLLPDGLHVDTNNSKHFRHFTILFYLNSCATFGATSFPLAIPYIDKGNRNYMDIKQHIEKNRLNLQLNQAQEAANQLILKDVHHTRMADANRECLDLGRIVENDAVPLLNKATNQMGLRVMPEQGHICLFSNLLPDGYPNPLAFHGGEVMNAGESKEVLTFFYEIPVGSFTNRQDFGRRVQEREMEFLRYHYSNKP